jgi:hypothetical protein
MLLVLCLLATIRHPEPAVPFLSWDACPFECCAYGRWTATKTVTVRSRRSETAPVAFTVHRGETVAATTGVVVTTVLGIVRATRPLTLGESRIRVAVPRGDRFYILHYQGEGTYVFWYQGRKYSDARYITPTSRAPVIVPASGVELLRAPEWSWWIKVKNQRGQSGWILGNRGFDGSDSCS